jgi:hypothetical protein
LNGGGCAIYETRPDACRVWFCGWRLLPDLGDDWRPDICGVLIGLYREEDGHKGAYFKVVGSLSVLNNPRLAAVVAGMIAADVSTTLSVQGQPATAPAHVLLNLRLARAVAAGDLGAIIHGLNDAARTAIRALRAAGTSIL